VRLFIELFNLIVRCSISANTNTNTNINVKKLQTRFLKFVWGLIYGDFSGAQASLGKAKLPQACLAICTRSMYSKTEGGDEGDGVFEF